MIMRAVFGTFWISFRECCFATEKGERTREKEGRVTEKELCEETRATSVYIEIYERQVSLVGGKEIIARV